MIFNNEEKHRQFVLLLDIQELLEDNGILLESRQLATLQNIRYDLMMESQAPVARGASTKVDYSMSANPEASEVLKEELRSFTVSSHYQEPSEPSNPYLRKEFY